MDTDKKETALEEQLIIELYDILNTATSRALKTISIQEIS